MIGGHGGFKSSSEGVEAGKTSAPTLWSVNINRILRRQLKVEIESHSLELRRCDIVGSRCSAVMYRRRAIV